MKSNDNTPTFPAQGHPQQQLYPKKLSRPVHPPQPLMNHPHQAKAAAHQQYNNTALMQSQPFDFHHQQNHHQLQK